MKLGIPLRLKLALFNAIVVSMAIGLLGLLFVQTSQKFALSNIDQDLLRRLQRPARPPGAPPGIDRGPGSGPDGLNPDRREGPNGIQPDGGSPMGPDSGPGFGPGPGNRGNGPGSQFGPPNGPGGGPPAGPDGPVVVSPSPSDPNWSRLKDIPAAKQTPKGSTLLTTTESNGEKWRVATHVDDNGFVAQTWHDLGDLQEFGKSLERIGLLFVPIGLVFACVLGWLFSSYALRPLGRMKTAIEGLSAKDLGSRLETNGEDEIGLLSKAFNGLLDRLQGSFEREKRIVADASHELKTPVSRIKLVSSAAIEQRQSGEELAESVKVIDQAADSLQGLIADLLALSQLESGKPAAEEHFELNEAVRVALSATPKNFYSFAESSDVQVFGNRSEVVRAIKNVLENAWTYSAGKPIHIEITSDLLKVILAVDDGGPGIPEEAIGRLGERFYRVDESRSRNSGGHGLGLSIAKATMERAQGSLRFSNLPEGGLRVELIFKHFQINSK